MNDNTPYKYIYTNPLNMGFRRIKVSKQLHNKIYKFKSSQRTFLKDLFLKHTYFRDNTELYIEKTPTLLTKVLNTVLLPLSLVVYGLSNYKEIIKDAKTEWSPRKYGSFTSDTIQISSLGFTLCYDC